MIANFLKGGSNAAINAFTQVSYQNPLFTGQRAMSETLVVFVILCVPLFLCVKPCIALCCGEHHDEEKAEA